MTNIKITYQDGSEENLTAVSASYGDVAGTSIILHTTERGLYCVTQDRADVWAAVLAAMTVAPFELAPDAITYPYERAVQAHMDAAAKAAKYDDIKTAVTYAEEPSVSKFQMEGQAFRAWRSVCWAYCYEQLEAVMTGQRPQPTVEDFINELPVLTLPQ